MSPEFQSSIEKFTTELKGNEIDEDDLNVLSGLVYQFIQNLASDSCEIADVKGDLDEECFTFAVRKNKRMYKKMVETLEADKYLQIENKTNI